jgi:glucose-6-phosphate isomerase
MTLSLNDKFVKDYVTENDIENIKDEVYSAQSVLMNRTGEGNDFLGWLDLPVNYDKEEFERIKKAAEKIQKTCDILIVIGIEIFITGIL